MSDKNLFRRASERLGFRSSTSRMNSPPVVVNTSQSEPSGEEWVDEEGEGGQRATSNRSSRHAQQHSRTHQVHHPTHAIQRHSQQSRHTHTLPPHVSAPQLSPNSSPGFPDSLIYASDFMLGVGMVILQPSTGKCAVVYDSKQSYWLLPKGRKDANESLETAVLREAYEESGYRAQLLPLYIPTNCPTPRGQPPAYDTLTTEPIYVSTYHWSKIRPPQTRDCTGGEYLTFWYVGWTPEDAVWQPGTGVEFEEGYRSYLLTREEALDRLNDYEVAKTVLSKAYELLDIKNRYEASMAQRLEQQRRGESSQRAPPA